MSPRHGGSLLFKRRFPVVSLTQQRKWHEKNPNSPHLKDYSADWTEDQEDQARHKAWKTPPWALQDRKKFTQFSKGYSPIEEANTCPKPNMKSKEEYIVDSGASLHMTGEQKGKNLRQTKNYLETQIASGIIRSTEDAEACIQPGSRHTLSREVVEDSLLVLWSRRLCDVLRSFPLLATRRNSTLTKSKDTILQLLERLCDSFIDDDAVFRKTSPAVKKAREADTVAGNRTSFGCNPCGERETLTP